MIDRMLYVLFWVAITPALLLEILGLIVSAIGILLGFGHGSEPETPKIR